MNFTFGDAKGMLAPFLGANGLRDPSAAVNEAIDALTRTASWRRMRKIMRLTAEAGEFSLPQDCGQIFRVCVDRVPVRIYGADHEFLSNGPGDFDALAAGMAPAYGIQRLGLFPTMHDLPGVVPLCAFSTSSPSGSLLVTGRTADGDVVTLTVPVTVWSGTADITSLDPADTNAIPRTAASIQEILKVTLPPDAEAYIGLYCIYEGAFGFLARMHPRTRIPEFTRYRIPGFSAAKEGGYAILAECGVKPLRLVEDDEPMPFGSLRPVQYMLQSFSSMDAGEVETALKFASMAERVMLQEDASDCARQGLVVINTASECSNGQVSDDWGNC